MDKIRKCAVSPVALSVFLIAKNIISSDTANTFSSIRTNPAAVIIFDVLLVIFSVLLSLLTGKIYDVCGEKSNLLVLLLVLEPFAGEYLGDTFNLAASIPALLFLLLWGRMGSHKTREIVFMVVAFVSALIYPASAFGIIPAVFIVFLLMDDFTGDKDKKLCFALSLVSAAAGFIISVLLAHFSAVTGALGKTGIGSFDSTEFIFNVGIFSLKFISVYFRDLGYYWILSLILVVFCIVFIAKEQKNLNSHEKEIRKKKGEVSGFRKTDLILVLACILLIASGDIFLCVHYSTGLVTAFAFLTLWERNGKTEKYVSAALGFFDRHLPEISILAMVVAGYLLDKDTGSPFFTELMSYA